jgi:hypothetical protein
MDSVTTGGSNTAVGVDALQAATTASNNTAIGKSALENNTSGDAGVAVGKSTLVSNTTGRFNTGCGYEALYSNTTGGYNTAVGRFAIGANTTGDSNNAVGSGALGTSTTASNNVAFGNSALAYSTTASSNTALGHYAGWAVTTGNNNVLIGLAPGYASNAANKLTTGSDNILIGNQVNLAATSDSNSFVFGVGGYVGKGSNTSLMDPNSGSNYQSNNNSSWATTSDRRLKKNIVDSPIGLAEINQIKVRNFEYKTEDDLSEIEADGLCKNDIIKSTGVQVSAIAQEIQAVLPKCVTEESTGVLSVNADNLTWHLVKAVQELSAKNDALEARIVTLETG